MLNRREYSTASVLHICATLKYLILTSNGDYRDCRVYSTKKMYFSPICPVWPCCWTDLISFACAWPKSLLIFPSVYLSKCHLHAIIVRTSGSLFHMHFELGNVLYQVSNPYESIYSLACINLITWHIISCFILSPEWLPLGPIHYPYHCFFLPCCFLPMLSEMAFGSQEMGLRKWGTCRRESSLWPSLVATVFMWLVQLSVWSMVTIAYWWWEVRQWQWHCMAGICDETLSCWRWTEPGTSALLVNPY